MTLPQTWVGREICIVTSSPVAFDDGGPQSEKHCPDSPPSEGSLGPADLSSGPGLSCWLPSSSGQGWPWPPTSPSSHFVPRRKRTLAMLCGSILPEDGLLWIPPLFLPSMETGVAFGQTGLRDQETSRKPTLLGAQDLLGNLPFLWPLLFFFLLLPFFYKIKRIIGVGFPKQVACPNSCPSHYL